MGDRPAVLARELTKLHEELIRCPLSEMGTRMASRDKVRGECTLLVEGAPPMACEEADLDEALKTALATSGQSVSQVAKMLARKLGLPRKKVYDQALKLIGKR